ncbi:MAG: peptidylprolyl isomerase [archaeon]|nr:peptidylprolyl isomerase [archaeon]MDA1131513.1 peptidylprolyl isomerase [archaeon]
MAADNMSESWQKAEKLILKGKAEGALLELRAIDASGTHPTTLRIAGEATWAIAKSNRNKGEYRKAASLLKESVKNAPSDKKANASYNELLNEMQNLGFSETTFPRLLNDGTPTIAGMVAMGMVLVLILAGITVVSAPKSVAVGDVVMELSWTDTSGTSHTGTIWIELYEDKTPMHAESFRSNTDAGRYDGTIFHRIVDGFMIQGGDFENSDGTGGHAGKYFGYCANAGFAESTTCENDMTNWVIPAEFGETHSPGVIAAARSSSDDSAGSQFYLVDSTGATTLDNKYSAFGFAYKGEIDGSATTGVAVIDAISQVGCGTNQDSCNDDNKLSTYPVTVESAVIAGASADTPWYQFW